MVGCTLLGCISDIGGLTRDVTEGVWGVRVGDDMAKSRLLVVSLTGLCSRSATDSRFAAGAAFGSGCYASGVSGDNTSKMAVLLCCVALHCALFTYLVGAGQSSGSTSHDGGGRGRGMG